MSGSPFHRLRVARIIDETRDARSFVLEVPPALAPTFRYRAGQFLTFRVPHPDGAVLRCYSLSSAPDLDREVTVTVKRVAGGRGSNWFHDGLKADSLIEVMPPAGRFTLGDGAAPLLFFAGGSGITPVMSLMKTALVTTERRVRLFYANRDADSIIFRAALAHLATAYAGRLELRHHLDAEHGFAGAADITEALAGFADAEAYLCGPAPFMALVEATLLARGLPRERVRIERFEAAGNAEVLTIADTADGEPVPTEVTVHLNGKTHRVPYRRGQTLLVAARAAGLNPNSACEEGFCASCAAKLLKGRVTLLANDIYTAEDLAQGWILTCQGQAWGDVAEITYDTI